MSPRAKFLFDEDFGAPKAPPTPAEPAVPLTEHRAALRQAEEAAFLRGVAEGRRQSEADEAARLAASMQRLALHFGEAAGRFVEIAARTEQQAAALAFALARKLAGALLDKHPLAPVEALARSVFAHLRATPHAVVRVNAGLVEAVKPRLDAIAREAGFAGTIVVLGEPDIAIGDARVEWADGGAVREAAALEAVLDDAVRRHLDPTSSREEQSR